ncbi:MAG: hypothetical protein U0324_31785 [Polyangiales bacterium]
MASPISPGLVVDHNVRAFVGEGAFARAQEYVREGAVFDARRQGDTLRGACEGQSAESYDVRATVSPTGEIGAAACTCPVGADGRCKHVAALLLTYARTPGDFVVVDDVDAALAKRSRAELIAVIRQMLRQRPELETLLVTPLPDGRARTPRRLPPGATPRLYRRQADAVFRRHGSEWGAVVAVVPELRAIAAIGEGFVAQGDAASAFSAYEGLVEAVLVRYAEYERQDEEGVLRHVITECVEGLGRCLALPGAATELRERILRLLFDLLEDDDHLGDAGPVDEAGEAIVRYANDVERALVARWLRALSPDATAWHARPHAGVLLDLERDSLPDDEYLAACVALGRDRERVERLLARGRREEALEAAREASVSNLRAVADAMVAAGEGVAAEAVVRDRSGANDPGLFEWLLGRARAAGDGESVARWSEALLLAAPSIDRWRAAKRAFEARGPEAWGAARGRLLAALERRAHRVAVEALLDEGDLARALVLVESEPTVDAAGAPVPAGMKLRVAEAAERSHPREAMAIWKGHVRDLIASGRRSRYREAAEAARRVCALYDAAGDAAGAARWVEELRAAHGRLRALREELAAAGL